MRPTDGGIHSFARDRESIAQAASQILADIKEELSWREEWYGDEVDEYEEIY
jgi:hypothetical protein